MDVAFNIDMREQIGTIHFMKQLQRSYDFPVEIFRVNEDGSRELIRVEH